MSDNTIAMLLILGVLLFNILIFGAFPTRTPAPRSQDGVCAHGKTSKQGDVFCCDEGYANYQRWGAVGYALAILCGGFLGFLLFGLPYYAAQW